ncbi:MAG: response regulator transcription factor [Cyclobacteriaceae bacterium]|jgi:DNA-binding response OmpR family regulator|nr:response regulator transcription factor [Cyclobacteriaceae bacterium]
MSSKILLVEDDPNLGFVIKDNLEQKGFEVTLCENGLEGEKSFQERLYDLCILDVMMPKQDGFTLAKHIRAKNQQVPILFVTAKSMLEDKIEGFQSGGDDYIVKPFSMEELYLRIGVFLRRSKSQVSNDQFKLGSYSFDFTNYTLHHGSGSKILTQKEAEVLKLLCENRDRVLKREEILKAVWGNDDYFMGRSMDVFISKLRKYLKEDSSVEIVNYHGVGFRLQIAQ